MFAVGVLAFIFVDVMSNAASIVGTTLTAVKHHHSSAAYLVWLVVLLGAGGAVLIGMGVLIWTGEFTQLNVTVSHWIQSLGLPNLNGDT